MARKYLNLAMKNPGPYAYRLAGEMKLHLRLYQEALSEYEHGLTLSPNDPAMHEDIAWGFLYAGKPKAAIDHARIVMRYDPRRAYMALWIIGLAHFSTRELEQAAAYFERALTYNPEVRFFFLTRLKPLDREYLNIHPLTPDNEQALFTVSPNNCLILLDIMFLLPYHFNS